MRKVIVALMATLAFSVSMATPANALRPAPGQHIPDQCSNIPGYQGIDDIIMGRYVVVHFKRWDSRNICVPGKRHPSAIPVCSYCYHAPVPGKVCTHGYYYGNPVYFCDSPE